MSNSDFTAGWDRLANGPMHRSTPAVLLMAAQATARDFFPGHIKAAIMAPVDT